VPQGVQVRFLSSAQDPEERKFFRVFLFLIEF